MDLAQQLSNTGRKGLKKPRKPYRQVVDEWNRAHPDGFDALPEHISDQYSIEEKQAALEQDQDEMQKKDHQANNMQDISDADRQALIARMLGSEELPRPQGPSGAGGGSGGSGYHVVDLDAVSQHPDNSLLDIDDGTQELLDPNLTSAQIDALCAHDDPHAFLKCLDLQFLPKNWVSQHLEYMLSALRHSNTTDTLEGWRDRQLGTHVVRFVKVGQCTARRTLLVFFARRDLYLFLVLEQASKSGDTSQLRLITFFYSWSISQAERLVSSSSSSSTEGATTT